MTQTPLLPSISSAPHAEIFAWHTIARRWTQGLALLRVLRLLLVCFIRIMPSHSPVVGNLSPWYSVATSSQQKYDPQPYNCFHSFTSLRDLSHITAPKLLTYITTTIITWVCTNWNSGCRSTSERAGRSDPQWKTKFTRWCNEVDKYVGGSVILSYFLGD